MEWWSAPGDALARLAFSRALAGVYLLAFLAALRQFRPLLGERGLMPIPRYTASSPFARSPSVFHVRYSDRFFAACCWVGMALAGLAVVGVVDRAPLWGWMIIWAVLWAQNSKAQGIGVHFKNDESGIEAKRKIEGLLGGVMQSTRPTHTM